jgi:hypothetical protein
VGELQNMRETLRNLSNGKQISQGIEQRLV